MLHALRTPLFWRWYLAIDESHRSELDASVVRALGDTVSGDEEEREIEVRIPLPSGHDLVLSICIDFFDISLDLDSQGREMTIGWQDDARPHPYGLRLDEARTLASLREDSDLIFALLLPFVGFPADGDARRSVGTTMATQAFGELGLSPADASRFAEAAVSRLPGKRRYTWTQDAELGWVFAGDNTCHSLRNRRHLSGAHGAFPFEGMKSVRDALGLAR